MKLSHVFCALALTGCVSLPALAQNLNDAGHGKVRFHGFVIDAPCSISPESVDQTVELGQISNVVLKNKGTNTGKSQPENFSIQLVDCEIAETNPSGTPPVGPTSVNIKFSGAAPLLPASSPLDGKVLATTGQATGIGIQITEHDSSSVVELNKSTNLKHYLQNGENTLMYSAYVTGLGSTGADDIQPGEFFAVTDFTLSYE